MAQKINRFDPVTDQATRCYCSECLVEVAPDADRCDCCGEEFLPEDHEAETDPTVPSEIPTYYSNRLGFVTIPDDE